MTGRVEMVGRVSGRRSWSDAEKLEILAEAFRPGARGRDVIARREVSSSLIYTWRKQARLGKLGGDAPALPSFAEVRVAAIAVPVPQPATSAPLFEQTCVRPMRLEMRRIDHRLIRFPALRRERCEDFVKHAEPAPADEAVVDRLRWSILYRAHRATADRS